MKTFIELFVVTSILLGSRALAQETQPQQTIFTSETITIESTLIDCIDNKNGTAKQYQLLEVKNLTESSIQVRFKKQLWYGGKCTSCQSNSEEYVTSIRLGPNGHLTGDCESNDKQLKVFVRMLNLKDVSQLTHFELVDLEITEL